MNMTLWIFLGLMSLIAVGFAVWPLYRRGKGFSPIVAVVVVLVVGLSAGLYNYQGSPAQPSGGAALAEMDDAVAGLAARLEANPDDPNGWQMLGRSYMSLGNYFAAVAAFEKAVELESSQNPQALVGLGEALLAESGSGIEGHIAALFENALALDPNNPQALFYGGIGSFNRDDKVTAANRWEQLLALNPPAEIQGILKQRIAEWRGEEPPAMAQAMPEGHPAAQPAATDAAESSAPVVPDGAVVSARISLTDTAASSLPAEATVFLIARDVAQPVPPIAVARRRLSELPTTISLGDRESMVPGRELSTFAEFELLVRVSVSGQPSAQPGDWYGSQIVTPTQNNAIDLAVDQMVQ
jgi:cytochrome c-type biogenesis protein CcmH